LLPPCFIQNFERFTHNTRIAYIDIVDKGAPFVNKAMNFYFLWQKFLIFIHLLLTNSDLCGTITQRAFQAVLLAAVRATGKK